MLRLYIKTRINTDRVLRLIVSRIYTDIRVYLYSYLCESAHKRYNRSFQIIQVYYIFSLQKYPYMLIYRSKGELIKNGFS